MKRISLLLMAFLFYSASTFAQLKSASINDLAFMTGTWFNKNGSVGMEEFWGKPMGDNMASTFRYIKKGKATFYEFVVIEQTDSVPVMKIRHFNRGSIGWEDKDKPFLMPLVKLTQDQADFQSVDKSVYLIYRRLSPMRMDAILEEKNKEGLMHKEVFSFTLRH